MTVRVMMMMMMIATISTTDNILADNAHCYIVSYVPSTIN